MAKQHSLGQEVFHAAQDAVNASPRSADQFRRHTTIGVNGFDVEVDQSKFAYKPDELERLSKMGAKAFATSVWFNEVSFEEFEDADGNPNYDNPHVTATFPLGFFPAEDPNIYEGDGKAVGFSYSYGDRSSYSDDIWELQLVNPFEHSVNVITSDDAEAMKAYNERAKWYLEQLSLDANIAHDRIRSIHGILADKAFYLTELSVTSILRESIKSQTESDERLVDGSAYILGSEEGVPITLNAYADGTVPTFRTHRNFSDSDPLPASEMLLRKVLDKLVTVDETQ